MQERAAFPAAEHVLRLKRFAFEAGPVLADFEIAFWTMGELNARRDNVLLIAHNASGTRHAMRAFCGAEQAFDPDAHFLIALDAPGGGGSARRGSRADFPEHYSVGDCAAAAAALLEHLDLRARAFCGPSMASLTGLELAARRPDLVGALVFWVGGWRSGGCARASAEALGEALLKDASEAGWVAAAGAFFRAIAGEGMLAAMRDKDIDNAAEAMARDWRTNWRANELASRYASIALCDVAARHGGEDTLAAKITCPTLWLQAAEDSVFPTEKVRALARRMPNATLKTIDSPLGHLATTAPVGSLEHAYFVRETRAFLAGLNS